jgi:hypothetical protein
VRESTCVGTAQTLARKVFPTAPMGVNWSLPYYTRAVCCDPPARTVTVSPFSPARS